MGLSQALSVAVSGLHATQAGVSGVAGNIPNASTPGYVHKTVVQNAVPGGDYGDSVRVGDIQRQLDQFVQSQLRSENAGASYADIRSQFYDQLQSLYGQPNSDASLDGSFNTLTTALQSWASATDDISARIGGVNAAQQ